MTCSACSGHVEKEVSSLNGVLFCNVSLLNNSMVVEYDENILDDNKIINAVIKAGYNAQVYEKIIIKDNTKKRIIISFIFLALLMYLAMGHMFNLYIPKFIMDYNNGILFPTFQIILLLPIIIVNYKYFTIGYYRLVKLSPNMDTLIALSSSASIIYGIYNTIKMLIDPNINASSFDFYFESAGMILSLVTLGKFIEAKSKRKTTDAITKLMDLAPKKVIVVEKDEEVLKDILAIKENDIILIKPGMNIPVDGIVVSGESSIDEKAITGESIPVYVTKDSKIISGTKNLNGSFLYKALKKYEDSTISKIIELVNEASSSKAPIQALADKISFFFVPVVIFISIITFIIWMILNKGLDFSLSMAISVLVISCPCALGLATPVCIMVGTGKAALNGILVKSASALQIAHSIDTVLLDKTGTVTNGLMEIVEVETFNFDYDELLKVAKSLEMLSNHPLAYAFSKLDYDCYLVNDFENLVGSGIKGIINGDLYKIGNERLVNNQKNKNKALTQIYISKNDELIGIIGLKDTIRSDSLIAINLLKKMKIKTVMLTGDNEEIANAISNEVGFDEVISRCLPSDKYDVIKKYKNESRNVMMIGDGINDSIALTEANVGVAIGCGSDIAIDCADIILVRNSLLDMVDSIRLSKYVFRVIKMNLFWAFFYNIIGIPIAAGILYPLFGIKLNPMIASMLMSMSSLCVVFNALRIINFKQTKGSVGMTIKVKGMMCEKCKKHVYDAVMSVENVTECEINLKKGLVTVSGDALYDDICKAIVEAGYEVK